MNVIAEVNRRLGEQYSIGIILDLLVAVIILGSLYRLLKNPGKFNDIKKRNIFIYIIVFVTYCLLISLIPSIEGATFEIRIQGLRLLILAPLFGLIAIEHSDNIKIFKNFILIIIILGVFQSIIGIYQKQIGQDLLVEEYLGYGSQYAEKIISREWGGEIRAFGWLIESYIAASVISVGLIALISYPMFNNRHVKILKYVFLVLLSIMLILTFTRMVWIAFICTLVFIKLKPKNVLVLLIIVIIAVSLIIILLFSFVNIFPKFSEIPYIARVLDTIMDPFYDPSISLRILDAENAWKIVNETFIGLGPGTSHAVAVQYGFRWNGIVPAADNQYLQYLIEIGFPGLLLFMLIFIYSFIIGWKKWVKLEFKNKYLTDSQNLFFISFSCLFFLSIISLTGLCFTTSPISYYAWYIICMVCSININAETN